MDPVVGFLVGVIVRWLAGQGVGFLKNWSTDHEEQLEDFVKSIVPGDKLDDNVWATLKGLLPWLIDKAAENIDRLEVSTGSLGQMDDTAIADIMLEVHDHIV